MVWLYIISAMTFTLGNVFWTRIDGGNPYYYYIPLSLFLLIGAITIKSPPKNKSIRQDICLDWIILLAAGNVIKQFLYDESDLAERMDIYWGIFLACVFIPRVIYPNVYFKLYNFLTILAKFIGKLLKRVKTWVTGKPSKRH